MSEKLLPRVAVGVAGTLGLLGVGHAFDNDRSVRPEHNDPAAVARFNEALHGRTTAPVTENPSDMSIEAPAPKQKYMPHDVMKGETVSGIVHDKVEEGYIDPSNEQSANDKMIANNGGTPNIGENWGVQVPVDRTSLPITKQNAE